MIYETAVLLKMFVYNLILATNNSESGKLINKMQRNIVSPFLFIIGTHFSEEQKLIFF